MEPLISICIPAYKRTDFIKRLLDSICAQNFTDFEVIITDDSDSDEVQHLCNLYQDKVPLVYYRNAYRSGTPENWNEAIRKAKGQWIKLMHDDDWFSNGNSLQRFVDAINKNPDASFIFSAYKNNYSETGKEENVFVDEYRYKQFQKNAATLFSKNIIGPPSAVIHRKDNVLYDKNLKWLVDIDFYMRVLGSKKPVYINEPLITIGVNEQQVTKFAFKNKEVEIPEYFYLLNKIGEKCLKNIFVYDAFWRMLRNLKIRNKQDIMDSGYSGEISSAIISMINFQNKIPLSVLRAGFFSKLFMTISYVFS